MVVGPRKSTGVKLRFPIVEGLNCNFGLGGLKNCFHIIILSFGNCVDRSDQIIDRSYDEAMLAPPLLSKTPLGRRPPLAPPPSATPPPVTGVHVVGDLPSPTLKCQIPRESGRSQAPRRQQGDIYKHPMSLHQLTPGH
ncbi:hypothetical protein F511_33715 [Dorcoceras hygrometricum]|uniref:Uncharacterized protein n=1 Tax=Dorcoceras hygrometricum TaxID=472368 RepID=A0A2Z7AYC4_9LAMI|nr:hypothetical protein F511_33715 [Dorcoceras hygrometricum]